MRFKIILIIVFMINGLPLISNGVHGNTVSADFVKTENSQQTVKQNDISDFKVDIFFVSTSAFSRDEIFPTKDNIYDIVDPSVSIPLIIRFNVSGWNSWNLGNMTLPGILQTVDFGNDSKTVGQIFLQVDNKISILTSLALTDFGETIVLSKGDHLITIIYIGYEDGEIVYTSDSIVIRIRDKISDFEDYTLTSFDIDISFEDLFEQKLISQKVITSEEIFTDFTRNAYSYYLNYSIIPPLDTIFTHSLSIAQNDSTLFDNMILTPDEIQEFSFSLAGSTNSTGFAGLQILGNWEAKQGITLFYDATGIYPIDSINQIILRSGLNSIGIIVLNPYGLWHSNIPCSDGSYCENFPNGVSDWENINASDDFNSIRIDSSFDFSNAIDGITFILIIEEQMTSETKESGISILILPISLIALVHMVRFVRGEFDD